jgi:hypothetical protein
MNKEFIPYEQALELKELGFLQDDTTCRCVQNEGFEEEKLGWGILYQQAFRWFREKYGLVHCIGNPDLYPIKGENFHIGIGVNPIVYEETELACLKNLIEIAKNK